MAHLFKKAAVARNIPLLALALFVAVFTGSKVYAAFQKANEPHWVYTDSSGCSETNPNCYTPTSSDLSTICQQLVNEVCGISAPDNGNGQPLIEGQLAADLASGDFENKPNIFRMPLQE